MAPDKIINLIKDFKHQHGRDPSRLYVSVEDAASWEAIPPAAFGDLADKIVVHGLRKALPTFRGIPIEWDAPETKAA